ncbi:MAG: bifunctional nuclease family protein [Treponema sp.]|jgi:bifunctional DNase/RNase|nr:bifunctional nuclease family protein [Treponema sp.]
MMDTMREVAIWTITKRNTGGTVVLKLLDAELVIPVFVDLEEVQSILKGYDASYTAAQIRPGIHDMLLDLVQQIGLALLHVELYTSKNTSCYAKLVFSERVPEEGPLVVQGRPGDAFALAVRRKCPLYVSQMMVDCTGIPVDCFIDFPAAGAEEWVNIPPLLGETDIKNMLFFSY